MKKRKILFLGETYRADAQTWIKGLEEFGDFDIISWELKTPSNGLYNRVIRLFEFAFSIFTIKKIIQNEQPDMIIAERTTSYGFLAALSKLQPIAIAQQGHTDLWPENSLLYPLKKAIQRHAFKKATLIHAWGSSMAASMAKVPVDPAKIMILAKGIDLKLFNNSTSSNPTDQICAIVTRSLLPEYRHDIILKAFAILDQKGIPFQLTFVGHGTAYDALKTLAQNLNIASKVHFTGRIPYQGLPPLLQASNYYISMPITEGVSASLFEAMATNCYPIVTNIPGNSSWITDRKNGQLITVDDFKSLADELIWAHENPEFRNTAINYNHQLVTKNADYSRNMRIIADAYHTLINTKTQI